MQRFPSQSNGMITERVLGDVNRDGTVNLPDIVLLQKHLCNKATLKKRNAVAADLNADGAITILDAVLLKRKLL